MDALVVAALDVFTDLWPHLLGGASVLLALLTSMHVVIVKRDARAALLWVSLVWLSPIVGALLYLLIGINRIRRRDIALERALQADDAGGGELSRAASAGIAKELLPLVTTGDRVVRRPLVAGNAVTPLDGGGRAYPAMLEAIASATRSVALETYIFDLDAWGERFVDALGAAAARGVEVRVLIDAVGARYAWPKSTPRALRRRGVKVARFLPLQGPLGVPFMNLRDHRKILVVDGARAFTGGMNLRAGHVLEDGPRHPVRDLHFLVEGPVVAQLFQSFAEDWRFTTKEQLTGAPWATTSEPRGDVVARVISDGPDEDFERLRWMYVAAVNAARHSVRIVTPYFVPDQGLLGVIAAAALRGVAVEIVLPARSNLPVVDWATRALLWQVLEHGCRVMLTPAPFDHTKLLVVDDAYVMLGSGNWDARSTRLNFELDLECHGAGLARAVSLLVDERVARARELRAVDVRRDRLPTRVRNGVARLLSPYL